MMTIPGHSAQSIISCVTQDAAHFQREAIRSLRVRIGNGADSATLRTVLSVLRERA